MSSWRGEVVCGGGIFTPFAGRAAGIDDVVEKQADMLRFMQQHNDALSARLSELAEKVAEYESGFRRR